MKLKQKKAILDDLWNKTSKKIDGSTRTIIFKNIMIRVNERAREIRSQVTLQTTENFIENAI